MIHEEAPGLTRGFLIPEQSIMAKNNPHDITVGQQLFVVYDSKVGRGGSEFMEVLKVGNKWATLGRPGRDWGHIKVHLVDRYIDGGQYSSPGSVYLSEQEYGDVHGLAVAWAQFRKDIPYRQPDGLTLTELNQAKVLLGMA